MNYAHSQKEAEETAGAICQQGRKAIAFRADVGLAADVRALFVETQVDFGQLDILVNNAGGILEAIRLPSCPKKSGIRRLP